MSDKAIQTYYARIRDAITEGNLPLVAEIAHSGLCENPKESGFAKAEIVALIKLDKSAQALKALERARGAKLISKKELYYECAYCHFTLGNYADAKRELQWADSTPAVSHLLAQIAYKDNKFDECIKLYEKLLDSTEKGSDEYTEILLNLTAARTAATQFGLLQSESVVERGNYELMFNTATDMLARGKAKQAGELLEEALAIAKSQLSSEGWSEEEIRAEVSAISAQHAIALHKLGQHSKAETLYNSLLSGSSLGNSERMVVKHNLVALGLICNRNINLARAKKALQTNGNGVIGLSSFQNALMMYNMVVMHISQGQYALARRTLSRLSKRFSEVAIPDFGVSSAIIDLRSKHAQNALEQLATMSRSQPPAISVRVTLAASQLAIALGDRKRAAEILDTWEARASKVHLSDTTDPASFARYYFGIARLSNWLTGGSSTGPSTHKAAIHLYTQATMLDQPSTQLLAVVSDCFKSIGDDEYADKIAALEKRIASAQGIDDNDSQNMSLHSSVSNTNTELLSTSQILKGYSNRKRVFNEIPGLPRRYSRKFMPRPRTTEPNATSAREEMRRVNHSASGQRSNKYRARRQRRLVTHPPKSYDPEKKQDKERWIPLTQRSYYKPRGRNRRRQHKLRGGAQGGATEADSGLGGTGSARISGHTAEPADDSNTAGAAEERSPQTPPPSSSGNAKGGKSGKNKSSKGKSKGKGKGKGKKGW